MRVLLGVDLGTTACKVVAITPDGRVLAQARGRVVYRRPAPGRIEFDATAQFRRLARLIRTVVTRLPRGAQPAALGLSGASGNTLLLDARRQPLGPAISWLDTRAGDDFQALLPGLTGDAVRQTVGWSWSRRFSLTQLGWLRRHQPEAFARAACVAPDLAYYHAELTGRLAIDHSTATNFFLQDQRRRRWHPPFLRALGLTAGMLPELVASGTRVGGLTAAAAKVLGLRRGLPVCAGSFDHPLAAIAAGVMRPTDLLLSCGTSWVGFFPTRNRRAALAAGLIVDPFLRPHGPWGAMFSVTAVGTVVDSYLTSVFPLPRGLSLAERYARCLAAASTVPAGAEGRPIDPLAPVPATRAERLQLCHGASLGQLSRRLLAGVALALRRRLRSVSVPGFRPHRITMAGGPSRSAVWAQIVADVLGQELWVMGGEAGAVGAALLGGVGVGLLPDRRAAAGVCRQTQLVITPAAAAQEWYAQFD